uniref:Uncharacterized protein n=1 Tax=Salix viminalis TaxID=40686 RepID=A0A6N2N5B4_SALVM
MGESMTDDTYDTAAYNDVKMAINKQCESTVKRWVYEWKTTWTFITWIESNKKCYEPMVVSIGPYYRGKYGDFQEMEKFKVNMVRTFVQQSNKHIDEFYKTVVDVAEEARRCYVEDGSVELDDMTEFTKMMFLDGCFVIQFMHCLLDDHENLKMTSHVAALVARDILLLENQLPFLVLRPLMNLRFGDEAGMKLIDKTLTCQRDSCRKRISKFFRKTILLGAFNTPKDSNIGRVLWCQPSP